MPIQPHVVRGQHIAWCGSLLLCTGVATGLSLGCEHRPYAAKPDPLSQADLPQIVGLESFGSKLAYQTPVEVRDADTPLRVSVPLRYLSDQSIDVQYRFVFFDAAGLPTEPAMDWAYTNLPARAQSNLAGSALTTEAVDWRLELRKVRGGVGQSSSGAGSRY